jgi:hypothetical protein
LLGNRRLEIDFSAAGLDEQQSVLDDEVAQLARGTRRI